MPKDLPVAVKAAYTRAENLGFELSSEPDVGWLLAALSAAVPAAECWSWMPGVHHVARAGFR